MNIAFKHLEAKLRFGDLTVGQWAAILAGVLFALVFAQYLSPIGGLRRGDRRRVPGGDPRERGVLRRPERVRSVGADRQAASAGGGPRPLRGGRRRGARLRVAADGSRATTARAPMSAPCGTRSKRIRGALCACRSFPRPASCSRSRRSTDRPGGDQRRRVRAVLRVTPPNPLILSRKDRQAVAAGFCHLVGRLRPGQSLQFYVQARPVRLDELLADARREVEACAGPAPTRDRAARDRRRCRGGGLRGDGGVAEPARRRAGRGRIRRVRGGPVPSAPARPRAALAGLRRAVLARAPLRAGVAAHRRAVRESQAHVDPVRAELEALGCP